MWDQLLVVFKGPCWVEKIELGSVALKNVWLEIWVWWGRTLREAFGKILGGHACIRSHAHG